MKKTKETTNSTQTPTGSCLMTCLKFCLYIMLLPLYWIYGIVWFIFLRKKLNDDPKSKKKATTKYTIFTALSLLLFCITISSDSAPEPIEPTNVIVENKADTESDLLEEEITKEISKDMPTKQFDKDEEELENITEDTSVQEIPVKENASESVRLDSEQKNEADTQLTEPETIPVIPSETNVVGTTVVEQSSENSNNSVATDEVEEDTPVPPTAPTDTTTQSNTTMVWIDDTAARYHKKNGCGMNNAYQVTLEEAIAKGKTPCGRCYK